MEDTRLITENRLIAEFLGARRNRFTDDDSYEMYGLIECIEDGPDEKHMFHATEMPFKTDWNWLMEVVGRISSVTEEPEVLDTLRMALLCNDIGTAYSETVYLIQEINENK